MQKNDGKDIKCSFCGKSQDEVNKLIYEGWIKHNNKTDKIALHPLMAELIVAELINDKYQEVTGNLKNYFDEIYNKDIDVMFLGENENKNEMESANMENVKEINNVEEVQTQEEEVVEEEVIEEVIEEIDENKKCSLMKDLVNMLRM